jgi:type II secretory pathway component GspD/PulD (secretin)
MNQDRFHSNVVATGRLARSLVILACVGGIGGLDNLALGQDKGQEKAQEKEDPVAKKQREKQEAKEKEAAAQATQGGQGRARAVPQPGASGVQPVTPGVGRPPPGASGATGVPGPTGAAPAPKPPITVTGGEGSQPGGAAPVEVGPGEISLASFSEGLDLKALVEYVADRLKINIIAADNLSGTVVLNAPVVVKESELLRLLDALLEQHGFAILLDSATGFYKIVPLDNVQPSFDSELASTKVIPTGSVRPSSLADIIGSQIGVLATAPGAPGGAPSPTGRGKLNYLDDLGVIIVTDSPRRIELIQQMVNTVLRRVAEQKYIRFELDNISAPAARTRILDLVGKGNTTTGFPQQAVPAQPGLAQQGLAATNFDNLSDRLTADAQSNALILRGYDDEVAKITEILAVIDKPNKLEYKQYFAGSAAMQIAQLAERFGFGATETVETMQDQQQQQPGTTLNTRQTQQPLNLAQFGLTGQQPSSVGGPVLVVDSTQGTITYNGTSSQQEALGKLIATFNPQLELVEFRAYKIKNMPASNMSDLLQGLIFNQQISTSDLSNPFLSGTGNSRRNGYRSGTSSGGFGGSSTGSISSRFNQAMNQAQGGTQQQQSNFGQVQPSRTRQRTTTGGGGGGGGGGRGPVAFSTQGGQESAEGVASISSQDVFVLPDEANNQVVVKARARDHAQIKKLIDKLDQRRPQVYIDVQIILVTANDSFRLAFETQLINANGTGGVVNTNFGLGTVGSQNPTSNQQGILAPKIVATGLSGLTAAIIRSDQVPIVMTALKENSDTRIVSSPQLLVDDNEHAEIVALDEQPTTASNIGTATTTNTFSDYVSAGTSLSVTPSISEGGYMRLEYEIELSNFTGTGTNGIPPPRQTKNVSSTSVTIPGNATIVVGGIKVDQRNTTVNKLPIIGDIPGLGILFRDTNKSGTSGRLYIFITPRIMRDVNFGDVTLMTKGPAADAQIDLGMPDLLPVMIEVNDRPIVANAVEPARVPAAKPEPPPEVKPETKPEEKPENPAPKPPDGAPQGDHP